MSDLLQIFLERAPLLAAYALSVRNYSRSAYPVAEPNGPAHQERVIAKLGDLCGAPDILTDVELFALLASAYAHDIGKPFDGHIRHGALAAHILNFGDPVFVRLFPHDRLLDAVAKLCNAHDRSNEEELRGHIDLATHLTVLSGSDWSSQDEESIRLRLLAALLRMSDELDDCRERFFPRPDNHRSDVRTYLEEVVVVPEAQSIRVVLLEGASPDALAAAETYLELKVLPYCNPVLVGFGLEYHLERADGAPPEPEATEDTPPLQYEDDTLREPRDHGEPGAPSASEAAIALHRGPTELFSLSRLLRAVIPKESPDDHRAE